MHLIEAHAQLSEDFASCGLVQLPLGRELPRGNLPQRGVRPVLIVVSLPLQGFLLRVSDREEQLRVEMLIPKPPASTTILSGHARVRSNWFVNRSRSRREELAK